jgi:hypothetical protein
VTSKDSIRNKDLEEIAEVEAGASPDKDDMVKAREEESDGE